ncbi:MAG TPA: ABC transporter substrate-binding protein [Usitatibacter sp.]|nr:ABC transporter substrate-binding protein [Usitatibacter sp.]
MVRNILAALALGAALGAAAETGVTDSQIVLGQSAVFTGPAQDLGIEMRAGALAYFNYVNAQGGVNGRRIVLKSLDDRYEPDNAAAATKQLINEDKVFALFGYVGTPTFNAAKPIIVESRVPLVAAFTGAESLRDPVIRYVFNVRASYYDETEQIVQHLTSMGIDKIAVFYQNDAYGKAGLEGVNRALKKRNMQVTGLATVERNTVEVNKAVQDMAKVQPQAIVMISAYKSCAAFIKAMKRAGMSPSFWNVSFVGSKALAKELEGDGRGVQISQVVPFPWDESIPVVREYTRLLKADGKSEPNYSSLEGFISAKVMVEGIRRAGKNLTRDNLIRALETMEPYDVGGFKIYYSPEDHRGSRYVDLTIISKDQKFVR